MDRILSSLKTIVPRFLRRLDRPFKVSVERQKSYLESLPEPSDLMERAYFQYKCQRVFWGRAYYFFANVVAFFLLPLTHNALKRKSKQFMRSEVDLLVCGEEMPANIFPEELIDEYASYMEVSAFDGQFWGVMEETMYCELVKRYRFSPYFIYKNMIKMAGYAFLIERHAPHVIAVCGGEFTYTSSFLTEYCRRRNVKHYNSMHGEMFFYILDSFATFDRFYVWDSYYIELQRQMRADSDEYVVAVPTSVKVDFSSINTGSICTNDYKYYLQLQPKKQMQKIAKQIKLMQKEGKDVVVRYHPRTVNVDEVYKIFGTEFVESPCEVPFELSLATTNGVIALNSTVLFQAYMSGKEYVLDDISEPGKINKLREMQYIILSKTPKMLSELTKQRGE